MKHPTDTYFAGMKRWRDEAAALRPILLACGLDEAIKWGKPCYAVDGKNLAIIQPMKAFLALMFFKGALLKDSKRVLEEQGEHSQGQRRVCFRSVEDVTRLAPTLRALVREAIAVEKAGVKVARSTKLVLVEELQARLRRDAALKAAFEALTPGRQRAYNIYFAGAKQAKTRAARIEKHVASILAGKGLNDR